MASSNRPDSFFSWNSIVAAGQQRLHSGVVCGVLVLQAIVFASISVIVNHARSREHVQDASTGAVGIPSQPHEIATGQNSQLLLDMEALRERCEILQEDNVWLREDNADLGARLRHLAGHAGHSRPYEAITASIGHKEPEQYGRVREKTIWSYWYHAETCPSAKNCSLPPHLKLCVETVQLNRGTFDYQLLHLDDVERYVNMYELPFRWKVLSPQHQKDSLMNALLSRYGGVALDISVLLLRPIDDYWDEMVTKQATFRGYVYRLNGMPWRHPEVTVVWFLMSRRAGIFGTAVRNQVEGLGDNVTTVHVYHQSYFALGDQTLLPILSMFNYSLPTCLNDSTVIEPHSVCPEREGPPWYKGITGPPRNDARMLLRDPRDGPQLPFLALRSSTWDITNSTHGIPHGDPNFPPAHSLGGPMYGEECSSMKQCWEDVFLRRYSQHAAEGEAHLLSFVKLFMHGKEIEDRSRQELLSNRDSFFFHWLKLAGLPEAS